MHWLQSLDVSLFRFVNLTLSNFVFDVIMPFLSGNPFFFPALFVLGVSLIWRGGIRGRLCVAMLLIVALGDPLICNTIKKAIDRPRPFKTMSEIRVPEGIGKADSYSMPSGHTANWFAATVVAFVYYRRSLRFMLPLAAGVGFSRIYNGVHYPSDVLAGAFLGASYAAAAVLAVDTLWQRLGKTWFPLWWAELPSLSNPVPSVDSHSEADSHSAVRHASLDQHWLRMGYLLILISLFARLTFLASGKIELSEDEAYQWIWSKHLALSYYSKPPLIAYTQFLGTSIWGDTAFGVRFFSPIIAAMLSFLLLRFFAKEVNAQAGFWLVLIMTATPVLAVGATLMTIDPLSVLFWTAAMLTGWRAIQSDSTTRWLWTGLWMGLGFLSKYTALFQWLCWAVFFVLWKPARAQLRRPGPYLALLINALCALPVIIWNQQHGWITATHLAERGGLDQHWKPTLRYFWDFLVAEPLLLNPIFFIAAVWAAIAFWRRERQNQLLIYLFSMGAPLFLFYFFFTFRARVLPNWIAPSVLPLFCLMVIYWESRWRGGLNAVKSWFTGGLGLGLVVVVLLHETNFVGKLTGHPLPPKSDPLRRVRAWKETARVVGEARTKLAADGKPVFIIGDHYGITGLLSFYLAEAKAGVPNRPLVYYRSADTPENQFYFWPGYRDRKGDNAIYVQQTDTPQAAPERIQKEFVSVTDLGMRDILYRNRIFHKIQLFECRNLR